MNALETNPDRFPLVRENDAFSIAIREMHYGMGANATHRVIYTIRPDRVVVCATSPKAILREAILWGNGVQ